MSTKSARGRTASVAGSWAESRRDGRGKMVVEVVEVVESKGAAAGAARDVVVIVSTVTETDEAADPRRWETMSDIAKEAGET